TRRGRASGFGNPCSTSVKPWPAPQGEVHEREENGYLHQRTDHGGERLLGRDSEDDYRHRDCELEVVARSGERNGYRLLVAEGEPAAHEEREQPHPEEVCEQRCDHAKDRKGECGNRETLNREHHYHREQESPERQATHRRCEPVVVPALPSPPGEADPAGDGRAERNTQEDEHAEGDGPGVHRDRLRGQVKPSGQDI